MQFIRLRGDIKGNAFQLGAAIISIKSALGIAVLSLIMIYDSPGRTEEKPTEWACEMEADMLCLNEVCNGGISLLCYETILLHYARLNRIPDYIRGWPDKKLYASSLFNGYFMDGESQGRHYNFKPAKLSRAFDSEIAGIIGPPPKDPDEEKAAASTERDKCSSGNRTTCRPKQPSNIKSRQVIGRLGEFVAGGNAIFHEIFYPSNGLPPLLVFYSDGMSEPHEATQWLVPDGFRSIENLYPKVRLHYSYFYTLANGCPVYKAEKVEPYQFDR